MESQFYATSSKTVEELRQRILRERRWLNPDILYSLGDGFKSELYYCMELGGGHYGQYCYFNSNCKLLVVNFPQ